MRKRKTLDVLRHSRHDWLNRLQLIKANLSLGRLERVSNLIDEIVLESNHESNLTNLHAPLFAEYLITYHWEPRLFSFEYEVIGNPVDMSKLDDILYRWISSLFTGLEKVVNRTGDNHLFLSLHIEKTEVRFFFDINGILEDTGFLKHWLKNQPNEFYVNEKEISIEESNFTVSLKL
ncbi:Spo0B C-terminal domain-containing protein [Sutcliffiella rhizosphaerae]|uniref:Sporulation initiation phosphotransferase B n=1 Tax=Sutcliffiella rhizosphaerae TaxID=2880967 RepID=A0ABN8A6G2_9BACI|nr:Spo0B C-terminal domain-containing protein [Sutcliffiella rhizosphaerae]CAG9619487.1 Sporulation initiation phosphotransferase B [Sutcliffiella rhizosphaerae]